MSTPSNPAESPTPSSRDAGGVPRWLIWTIGGVIGAVILFFGAILLYTNVIKDSPDELDTDDLAAALAESSDAQTDASPPETTSAETAPAPSDAPNPTDAPSTDVPSTTAPDTTSSETASAGASTWVATDASELGYRIKEVLFGVDTEGVGRTNQVEGSLAIDGTAVTDAEFTVDVASITSDESRRDNQFRGRIMSTDEFPTATFVLTEPIELGTDAVDGAQVETSATGDLTLRGVTNSVTFDVTAELSNGRIGVLGNIPVVFADYQIANPSTGGITTEDNGLLEFVLVFEPS